MAKIVKETTVVTNKVRLGYVHVLEPYAHEEGQEPRYSAQIMIPKEDKQTLDLIKKAMSFVYDSAKDSSLKGVKKDKLKTPLRDGDEETNDDGEPRVPGHYFINARSVRKPIIVKNVNGVKVQTDDSADVYSGVYALVSLNFYAYNTAGNKGISAGLNNVFTTCKGEAIGGGTTAEEDFGDIELEDDFEDDDLF